MLAFKAASAYFLMIGIISFLLRSHGHEEYLGTGIIAGYLSMTFFVLYYVYQKEDNKSELKQT